MYANGSITVRPLPEEVHGTAAERTLPLRRLEGGPVEQREVDECLAKELLKVHILLVYQCPVESYMAQYTRAIAVVEVPAVVILAEVPHG